MPDALYAGGGIGLGPAVVPAGLDPYPAPLVTSEDGAPGPVKTAVTSLVREVTAVGWTAVVTYAKGWMPHATHGRPGAQPVESLAVRMHRGDRRAVAIYVSGSSWSWDSLWVWALGEFPDKPGTISAFRDAVLGSVNDRPSLKDLGWGPVQGPRRA
jgi:hypothetical protein